MGETSGRGRKGYRAMHGTSSFALQFACPHSYRRQETNSHFLLHTHRNNSSVDFRTKVWTCPFCMTRCVPPSTGGDGRRERRRAFTHHTDKRNTHSNHFPPHYAENISEQNLPVELFSQYTTVEYELQVPPAGREGGKERGRENDLNDATCGIFLVCLSLRSQPIQCHRPARLPPRG